MRIVVRLSRTRTSESFGDTIPAVGEDTNSGDNENCCEVSEERNLGSLVIQFLPLVRTPTAAINSI